MWDVHNCLRFAYHVEGEVGLVDAIVKHHQVDIITHVEAKSH